MPLERMLRQLRDTCGSQAAAVVSRDGLVIAGDMPESISRETFAIMCATILGAGMTAATELRVSSPSHIVLTTKETRIHIFEAGPRALIVLVAPPSRDDAEIRNALKPVLEEIRREIG
jgi:predicted regulator of Ras-like GTPase activity (Roadblock/LC7/MglB family)